MVFVFVWTPIIAVLSNTKYNSGLSISHGLETDLHDELLRRVLEALVITTNIKTTREIMTEICSVNLPHWGLCFYKMDLYA